MDDRIGKREAPSQSLGWATAQAHRAIQELDSARLQWLIAGNSLDWRALLAARLGPEQAALAERWALLDGFDPARAKAIAADRAARAQRESPSPLSKKTRAAIEALRQGDPQAFAILLADGADERAVDARGRGMAHHAAVGGSAQALGLLSRMGMAMDGRDAVGDTPLTLAAAAGRLAAVEFLLGLGADPLAANDLGQTLVEAIKISGLYESRDGREIALLGEAAAERRQLGADTPLSTPCQRPRGRL